MSGRLATTIKTEDLVCPTGTGSQASPRRPPSSKAQRGGGAAHAHNQTNSG